ncbi:hypothetical protein Dsin_024995 [Dipteronia sinensis]|uniref:Putative plant transposon protein domain-containing protein n=1 Tax=Dipteronia sinensis TaxID=43782 RepID=A0AAD9ZUR9_9ROSI|nr:hypothetical protein Dsin_024995 [Dipteronia sinensis]
MKELAGRNVIIERGIHLEELRDTPIPEEPREYPNKFHLGSELRTGGGDNWNGHKLLRKDLLLESAFWYLFVSASLKPSVHGSEIFREASKLLYCIKRGIFFIDVARFIWKEIMVCGRQLDSSLVFPCLITAMCVDVGLVVNAQEEDSLLVHAPSLNLMSWNNLRKRRRMGVADDVDDGVSIDALIATWMMSGGEIWMRDP